MTQKALIIDDNRGDIDLIEEYFYEEGMAYQVFTADNGEDGLAVAMKERPEIIFLDIGMPGLDGYDVCRQLRLSGEERTHIVMMTGAKSPQAESASRSMGADDFCSKKPGDIYEKLMRYYHIKRKAKGA